MCGLMYDIIVTIIPVHNTSYTHEVGRGVLSHTYLWQSQRRGSYRDSNSYNQRLPVAVALCM